MKKSVVIPPDEEGVTHYRLQFRKAKPVSAEFLREVNHWRSVFHALEWIGQQKNRYNGIGFGNISRRRGNGFVVSGTQTGRRRMLLPRHFSVVHRCDPLKNFVAASGPVAPSSESMTHKMIYDLDRDARVVIHVHAPQLWAMARRLRIPVTSSHARYGTPEMAAEVRRLYASGGLREKKIFSMAGHRDGVVSFGRTAEEAGNRLLINGLMGHAIQTLS